MGSPSNWLILIGVLAAIACAGCSATPAGPRSHTVAYLATYFRNNGEEGVYLASSDDGLHFRPIVEPNVPILKPQVGPDRLARDPCIFQGPDGRWHMVWTTGWWCTSIGLAHSDDLVHWSKQDLLPVMNQFPGTLNAWAPEITFDPVSKRYILFWSSTVPGRFQETAGGGDPGPSPGTRLNHRIYRTTTTDFVTYTPTALMYEPGFNCIDATLLRLPPGPDRDSAWLLFLKDETRTPPAKNIRVVHVGDPLMIQEPASAPITGAYWAEGPTAFWVGDRVRVFFDRYMDGRFGAVESVDGRTWTDISDQISVPREARHGSVVAVDAGQVERIRKALAAPSP